MALRSAVYRRAFQALADVATLTQIVDQMRDALVEARCWIPDGSRRTPEQRGAKCATVQEVDALIQAALEVSNG